MWALLGEISDEWVDVCLQSAEIAKEVLADWRYFLSSVCIFVVRIYLECLLY